MSADPKPGRGSNLALAGGGLLMVLCCAVAATKRRRPPGARRPSEDERTGEVTEFARRQLRRGEAMPV